MLHVLLALTVSFESRAGLVSSALIVGRAVCHEHTYLLTDTPQLLVIAHRSRQVKVHPIRGSIATDKIWGLACTADGALWTLAAARVLARLSPEGEVVSRLALPLPRIALFAAGDRLVHQQLPLPVGTPALMTSLPAQPLQNRPWPALTVRQADAPEKQIARNLVTCGLALNATLPCWFTDERQFSVSDGSRAQTISAARWLSARADRSTPIRDVAMTAPTRYWLLESTTGVRGVVGGRLSLVGDEGVIGALDLPSGARLILAASAGRCLLLTVDGALLEVSTP